eukprot:SAG25_NODE_13033_length_272_cov_0.601156_1_plen_28_part_01
MCQRSALDFSKADEAEQPEGEGGGTLNY